MDQRHRRRGALIAAALLITSATTPSVATDRSGTPLELDLPPQDMATSLRAVARLSGQEIMIASGPASERTAPALRGRYTAEAAVATLLAGSGLVAERSGEVVIVRGREAAPPSLGATEPAPNVGSSAATDSDIVVTGTRIRGAPSASKVIVQSQEQMRTAGQSNLGEFVRSLPQSFAGGQNPGVTEGASGYANENVSSASTINLRGLGPDATLTLLNGHRLAYNSVVQGIDVSAIPLAAVDRVEIVADGASAIYGSDAVGGVANIVLKRSFTGLEATARYGEATEGGDQEQLYSAVTGANWSGGGVVAAAEFARSTAIASHDRSYTQQLAEVTTLLPFQRHYAGVLTGHQALTDTVELQFDGLYNDRLSRLGNGASFFSLRAQPRLRSFVISPTVKVSLPSRWTASLNGTLGKDRTFIKTDVTFSGRSSQSLIHYDNGLRTAELSAEGPLVTLPAGDVRLAFGGGYRSNRLTSRISSIVAGVSTTSTDFSHVRDSYFGYAELFAPVVDAGQDVPGIHSLSATGAIRYERYPHMAQLATPKLGLLYAPTGDIDLKASWGKSFKTPTLFQQYQNMGATLSNAADFGKGGYTATATTVELYGGNPNLKPERATTWSATAEFHPKLVPDLQFSATYFHVRYKNRIAEPIADTANVYGQPAYQNLITLAPSSAQLTGAIANAANGLENYSDFDYNPADVYAIIDDRFANVARQVISGFDLLGSYEFDAGRVGRIALTGNASHLKSSQQLGDGLEVQQLAGTIFDPPHWRARGGVNWATQRVTLSSYVNYIGGVTDNRFQPSYAIGSMTTIDLNARMPLFGGPSLLRRSEIALTINNLLDRKPNLIRTFASYSVPYDSTTRSAIGRFISLTLTARW